MLRTPSTLLALGLLTLSAGLASAQILPNAPFGPGHVPPPATTTIPPKGIGVTDWSDPPLPVRPNAITTPDSQTSLAAKSQHSLPLAPRGRAATAENATS